MFESAIKIAQAETNDLIELARRSGYDSREFFVGADLSDTDLRGLDFSQYYFTGVNLKGALTDRRTILPSDADLTETRYDLTPDIVENLENRFEREFHPETWPEALLYLFVCFGALSQDDFFLWAEQETANFFQNEPDKGDIFISNMSTILNDMLPYIGTMPVVEFRWHDIEFIPDRDTTFSAEGTRKIEQLALDVLLAALASAPLEDPKESLEIFTSRKVSWRVFRKTMADFDLKNLENMPRYDTKEISRSIKKIKGKTSHISRKAIDYSKIKKSVIFMLFLEDPEEAMWTKKFKWPRRYYLDFRILRKFLDQKSERRIFFDKYINFIIDNQH